MMAENFEEYKDEASEDILEGGPNLAYVDEI